MIVRKTAKALRFGLLRLLRLTALLVLALILAIVLLLKTSPGRNFVRMVAEAVVTDVLPGRLTIENVAAIGLSEVRLEGVRLFDPWGRRVIAVGEVMTAPVAVCRLDTDLAECKAVMTEKRIRHLPVVEKGKLAGIVTIGDVIAQEVVKHEKTIEYLNQYIYGPS